MNKVVLDANIYVKLFKKDEHDSQKAIDLVHTLVKNDVQIIEPSIVVNETITTCEYVKLDIQEACHFFQSLIDFKLNFIEITTELLDRTMEITNIGHKKSGYPTFNDSMYHAIALQEDALFITADKRHYEKSKQLGNIELLQNIR